jgi:hypothetical protein
MKNICKCGHDKIFHNSVKHWFTQCDYGDGVCYCKGYKE